MKQKFVDELHWIEEDEMLDLIAIVVGCKLAGIPGVLVSIAAAVIPPFAIITVISYFYTLFRGNFVVRTLLSGMQAGVGP